MVSSISPILWASFDIVIIVITVIVIVTSIMLATISDVWVQGAKLQRPRHHPRQLQYMQLPSNILIWVIIIVIMIIILCNIANFEGVKTQNWLHGGSLLYQPVPCRGGGPSGGMRHWFHASIEPSSFDDSSLSHIIIILIISSSAQLRHFCWAISPFSASCLTEWKAASLQCLTPTSEYDSKWTE